MFELVQVIFIYITLASDMQQLFQEELCELYFNCTLMICYSSLRDLRGKNFLEQVVVLFIRPCNHFGKLAYIITKIMCTVRGRLNCVQTVEVHTVCSTKYVQQQQPAAITRRTQRILQKAHPTTKHEIKGLRQSKCTILLKAAKSKRVFSFLFKECMKSLTINCFNQF